MKHGTWIAPAIVMAWLWGNAPKAQAADSLSITVKASIETLSIAWNSATPGDTAPKSWTPVFTAYNTTQTSPEFTIYNKNTYGLNLAVSASVVGANWSLAAATGEANAAVLKVGTDSIHASPKTFTNVSASQAFTLALTAPSSGNTSSGDITVTVTATKN